MANAKPQEKVIEEIGVIQRTTTQQISPSKRKREEEIPTESSKKYMHTADNNRLATTTREQNSLRVPFWKDLNRRQSSSEFHTNEIGSFSLLTRDDEKECFEDKRYLRSKYFYLYP
jgi:hypothetical protein